MGHALLGVLGLFLLNTLLYGHAEVPNKAVVTLQPNWTEVYVGERITLRCEIKDGGDTEWEYEWRTTSSEKPSDQNEHRIRSVTGSHSGDYRCKGRKKHTQHSSTDWSDPIKLTVSDKLWPVITVSPSWLSAGASVTLNCSVKDPSAGWKFYWYRFIPLPSDNPNPFYSLKQLPGSSSGTEQDSYILHGQTHTAGYSCRAGRGDPVFYTYYSAPKYVWSADIHSTASLTVSPDRAQHFKSDSVSLSCEGNSEWRVWRFSAEGSYPSECKWWGTMTGSTCNIDTDRTSDAVYWCESRSGDSSNAVNIMVQVSRPDSSSFPVLLIVGLVCGIVLVIPLLVLFCYRASKNSGFVKTVQSEGTNADRVDYENDLYHGDVCLYDTIGDCQEAEHDSGFIRTVHSESADAYRVDHDNDHYPALLHNDFCLYDTIGDCQEAELDSCFVRPVQTESGNADRVDHKNDHYAALLHGDVCLYDTIRSCQAAEHAQ